MGVKRFDLIESIGGEAWLEEAALGEYVKASDYDQLAAALRGYGKHVTSPNLCPAAHFWPDERGECDCGLTEWIASTSSGGADGR